MKGAKVIQIVNHRSPLLNSFLNIPKSWFFLANLSNGTVSKTYNIDGTDVTLCWMDRNLGATRVPESSADYQGYGDLFQWGRLDDGHQMVTWTGISTGDVTPTTSTLSTTDIPGHSDFITASVSPNDWRDGQNDELWQGGVNDNNPCPPGWRVPKEAELDAERQRWEPNNSDGAYASTLKWPVGGHRYFATGALSGGGGFGSVWSSTVSGTNAKYLDFSIRDGVSMSNQSRAYGKSVRCVRD